MANEDEHCCKGVGSPCKPIASGSSGGYVLEFAGNQVEYMKFKKTFNVELSEVKTEPEFEFLFREVKCRKCNSRLGIKPVGRNIPADLILPGNIVVTLLELEFICREKYEWDTPRPAGSQDTDEDD